MVLFEFENEGDREGTEKAKKDEEVRQTSIVSTVRLSIDVKCFEVVDGVVGVHKVLKSAEFSV